MRNANITWLTENIATGGDISPNPTIAERQFTQLLGMDIALVIDCRQEADDARLWAPFAGKTEYLYLPTDDAHGHVIPPAHFDAAVKAARKALRNGGRVFAHCHMGVNRGPSTAFAILIDQGMKPEDAFDLIRAKRPEAAVYYAEDALRAHGLRRRWKPETIAKRVNAFTAHTVKAFTTEDRKKVNHVIRQNHKRDTREWALAFGVQH